jgi:hypothetical protein
MAIGAQVLSTVECLPSALSALTPSYSAVSPKAAMERLIIMALFLFLAFVFHRRKGAFSKTVRGGVPVTPPSIVRHIPLPCWLVNFDNNGRRR